MSEFTWFMTGVAVGMIAILLLWTGERWSRRRAEAERSGDGSGVRRRAE